MKQTEDSRLKEHNVENEMIKDQVRSKYGELANSGSGCCSSDCCGDTLETSFVGEDYGLLEGYVKEADLGLGCGLPTEFAGINEVDVVVDLGSGAGNDVFIARNEAGISGRVIGIDFTESMVRKAQQNAAKLDYMNVEFLLGDIESLPLAEESADVVVSNCVFNLVPDKERAFNETFRILKKGGHFSISDIVLRGSIPSDLKYEA
jgi:SAM-dependent methyltransferase